MDLFIINRYTDANEDNDVVSRETLHLQRLKQKIEERKKNYKNHTITPDTITLKEQGPSQDHKINNEISNENQDVPDEQDKTETNIEDTTVYNKSKVDKPINEFKVLGSTDFEKKIQVERVLPYWLSHAYRISKNLQTLTCVVEDQDWLHSTLKATVASEGVTHLFPVQEQVIPFILKEHKQPEPFRPHDICVSAPTGSGKTLSFVLPIIQILMNPLGHHIRALIVLPVQELAAQIAKVFKKYCTNTGLRVALLCGSAPLQKEQQQLMRYTQTLGWICETDIIVCTAGRLVEHLHNTEGFSLKHLKFLVIDEADRIMDNIQNDWLYHLEKHIQVEMQMSKTPHINWSTISSQKSPIHKLLFSATLSPDPELLEQWGLFQPKLFSVTPINDTTNKNIIKKYSTPDELHEHYVVCSAEEKPLIFYNFFANLKWDKTLCFTNSSQSAHRLTALLNIWGSGKLRVAELSAALDRASRELVLRKFKQSEIDVIISTDALARGIDIPECDHVISYDPPRNIKTYIHRVGRTGRAGRKGTAVTIVINNQVHMFKEIIQSSGNNNIQQMVIQREVIDSLLENYESAIFETKRLINEETHIKVKKSIELKRGPKSKPRKRKHNENKSINRQQTL
ncbi:probable ATP-dependent RNA helicase Dbp73D [Pararge aegeria]|uniref:ATP-dependent RNA helicase n=2 Tax=Pararge aegeria TaxID=116150 RepID=A0A8S4RLH3_9NEOP|nr:probable ATP-dependent RNA helicase Dbp73D [Pararge aegeria]XP_039753670.1 probable ATP-dependent RNA helicase Dbp73D [Pararge aegeria]CAH2238952.1 jg19276 [Pararge aegeria aegeria]